jgi:hypothetical protein
MEEQGIKFFEWKVEKFNIIAKNHKTWSETSVCTWNNPLSLGNTKITLCRPK